MKKVIIISASPRKGGNSDILCDKFLEGAAEAGHQTEKIFLREKDINYCMAISADLTDVQKMTIWTEFWIK